MVSNNFRQNKKRVNLIFSIVFVTIFFIVLGISVLMEKIPLSVIYLYAILSILTFIIYFIDKRAAQKGKWRVKENTLQMLSLAGGWPGALLAQQSLRHKTKKRVFRIVFVLTVLLNIFAFVWFFWQTLS